MQIDWNASPQLKAIGKTIYELRQENPPVKWSTIVKIFGKDRTYLFALKKWYEEQLDESD